MFSHVFVGVTDFERALVFYTPVLKALGLHQRFIERDRPWAGWEMTGQARPLFLIGAPYDGAAQSVGNGQMVAFIATTREQVGKVHAQAMANGGRDEGVPGLRPEYHAHYYGAYFRDLDGNKFVACVWG